MMWHFRNDVTWCEWCDILEMYVAPFFTISCEIMLLKYLFHPFYFWTIFWTIKMFFFFHWSKNVFFQMSFFRWSRSFSLHQLPSGTQTWGTSSLEKKRRKCKFEQSRTHHSWYVDDENVTMPPEWWECDQPTNQSVWIRPRRSAKKEPEVPEILRTSICQAWQLRLLSNINDVRNKILVIFKPCAQSITQAKYWNMVRSLNKQIY